VARRVKLPTGTPSKTKPPAASVVACARRLGTALERPVLETRLTSAAATGDPPLVTVPVMVPEPSCRISRSTSFELASVKLPRAYTRPTTATFHLLIGALPLALIGR